MIRHAEADRDAPACAGIYGPYVRDTAVSFEVTVPSAGDLAERIERISVTHPWLVAEHHERVVGFAYASPHREREAYRWATDVTVYVGIALPNDASVRLHEALGFEPVGVYRNIGFKAGAWHDVGWWQLELAPAQHPPAEPHLPCSA